MNKKATVQDIAFLGVFMLIFVIAIVVGGSIFGSIGDRYENLNSSSTGIGNSILSNFNDRYTSLYDYIFITVLVFMMIGLLISFFLIDSEPGYFFVILILLIFIVIANAILSNVFEKFTSGKLASEAAEYSIMSYIMQHWVLVVIVLGLVLLGVMFAKVRTGAFGR